MERRCTRAASCEPERLPPREDTDMLPTEESATLPAVPGRDRSAEIDDGRNVTSGMLPCQLLNGLSKKPQSSHSQQSGLGMALSSCAPRLLDELALSSFRARDQGNLAKREIDPASVRSLDGSRCPATTSDGVALNAQGTCTDLGEPWTVSPAADSSHSHTPLTFLPPRDAIGQPAAAERARHAADLQAAVSKLQFPSGGCAGQPLSSFSWIRL